MYYLAIDQGTTGSTAALINANDLSFLGQVNNEFQQHYPSPGLVEHDLNEIWASVKKSVQEVLEKFNVETSEILSIGITNQRETTCAFSKSGSPLSKAIVWQDRRTTSRCNELKEKYSQTVKEKTGLPIDSYFSATKIEWLILNNKDIKKAYENDDCLFGTIDTFLIYKLTNSKSFVTEASNASRTMVYNINEHCWDADLLNIFGIKEKSLPKVQESFSSFGHTLNLDFLPDGIPITGCLGDQQSALFGQSCFEKGESKCTYGTGAFFLLNTGTQKIISDRGLLTTVAYRYQGKSFYALEGSCYIAGAAVQWLRDNLNLINNAHEIEALALESSEEKMKNLMFLPFFTGIASPYWKPEAKGALVGMTRDTGRSEIARSCLEGIALSINDLIESVEADFGEKMNSLRVDGGAVKNSFLLELQSKFSQLTIIRPEVTETTAYGAALAAAIGLGKIDLSDIKKLWKKDKEFSSEESSYSVSKKSDWKEMIKKLY